MSFSNGYQEEEYGVNLSKGDYAAMVKSVEEKTSKSSGRPMLEIVLDVNGFDMKFWIVDNEYKNQNLTKFFDCFKIKRGDFNYSRWKGQAGTVHVDKGKANDEGKSYFEIKYLVIGEPRKMEDAPQRKDDFVDDDFNDQIPFL